MLPVKKRFSMSEVSNASSDTSPKAPKRAKISADDEIDRLLSLRRDLALQRFRLQASAMAHPSATLPFAFGANTVSPESLSMPFTAAFDGNTAPPMPFPHRRASECVLTQITEEKSTSPLDLLSSVSTIVAGRRSSCPEVSRAPPAVSAIAAPVSVPQKEKYLGQRHPQTGLRHGKGIMKYSNGCRYVGFFVDDRRHGYGKCWYDNGSVYAGNWKEGKRDGKGTMTYANGDRYEGSWVQDQRHGSGIYHWKDGRSDVCKFHRQKIVGEGCRWSPDRQSVWLLRDGELAIGGTVPVRLGRAMAKKLGVQFP